MSIVSPSILSADFLELKKDLQKFNSEENLWFHLDIMDGHYVPNLTFGKTILKDIHTITSHTLDAHLMVSNPKDYINQLCDIGIHNFTFHWEAVTHHHSIIQEVKSKFKSVGISLNPGTDVSIIPDHLLKMIDVVLVMSVNPGFGGQKFIEATYDKIKHFDKKRKTLGLDFKIQVDGGVNDKNAKELRSNGADILVAGSFIFNSTNYSESINKLR
jgi:ribulose-phosphate 3-epimerase